MGKVIPLDWNRQFAELTFASIVSWREINNVESDAELEITMAKAGYDYNHFPSVMHFFCDCADSSIELNLETPKSWLKLSKFAKDLGIR